MKKYITLSFEINNVDIADALKAELGILGFDVFYDQDDTHFTTSILKDDYSLEALTELVDTYAALTEIVWQSEETDEVNWNAVWEESYEPVIVGDCIVRAAFHAPAPQYTYEIVITPNMSFGTGHHATTSMMLAFQLGIDHQHKNVADLGCGTGILSIMAYKRGAAFVKACDNDSIAAQSSRDNAALNHANVEVITGTVADFVEKNYYDIVLANIQLNVLLDEMPQYANLLKPKGNLLLSGFYTPDENAVIESAQKNGLTLISRREQSNWCALHFSL